MGLNADSNRSNILLELSLPRVPMAPRSIETGSILKLIFDLSLHSSALPPSYPTPFLCRSVKRAESDEDTVVIDYKPSFQYCNPGSLLLQYTSYGFEWWKYDAGGTENERAGAIRICRTSERCLNWLIGDVSWEMWIDDQLTHRDQRPEECTYRDDATPEERSKINSMRWLPYP